MTRSDSSAYELPEAEKRDLTDRAVRRIRPQGVRTALALEDAAVRAKVLQQRTAFHRTVTVSRSASEAVRRQGDSVAERIDVRDSWRAEN